MSVTSTSTTRVHASEVPNGTHMTITTTSTAGLASVRDSITSSREESKGLMEKVLSALFYPFHALSALFNSLFGSEQKLSADQERYSFIQDHLNEINNTAKQECLEKLFHIKNPIVRLEAFKLVQNSTQATKRTVETCFGQLPIDTQNHIKWHIWEANCKNDQGMGLKYGDYMIHWYSKHPQVAQAIDTCLWEAKQP